MKVLKSLYNTNKLIGLVLLSLSFVALPACEKSRLKVRPGVATTPNTQNIRPGIQDQVIQDEHIPEQPQVVTEDTGPVVEERVKRPNVVERHLKPTDTREQKPVSLGGIPTTTVNNHDNKTQTTVNTPANGADLNCQSKDCPQPPKQDQELPSTDIPDTKPTQPDVIVTPAPKEAPVIAEPIPEPVVDGVRQSVLSHSKTFEHFHLLLVIDRQAIHINKLGQKVNNDQIEVQREQILRTVEGFLSGFNNMRAQMVDSSADKEYSFTLGLVAGSNDARYIGEFFNKTKKEFNTKDIAGIQALISDQMNALAQNQTDFDKTKAITVNSNFVSLQKFIDSDPESINSGTKFLSENIPTVVLTMGNYSSDRCTIDSQTYGQDPDCDQRHSYGALLKTMIKKKYYGSNTPGIFAPVTFKHIYLNGRNDTVSTYKKTNSQSRVAYDAESHGVRFAAKTLVKQEIDRVESTFSAAALIVNGRYDETCIIDQSNNYIKTSIPSFSTAEVVTFNQDPESIPADRRCKLVESSVFNNSVIEKLYQEEIQLLEN